MGREVSKENLQDGKILEERSCTDICMIFVFLVFLVGWIIILSVAINQGKPSRILLPENFEGKLCGDEGGELESWPFLFVPKTSRPSYGLCAKSCPAVFDYVCNNMKEAKVENASDVTFNTYYDHTASEYLQGQILLAKCTVPTACSADEQASALRFAGLLVRVKEYKCFLVYYASGSTLKRCIPYGDDRDNATLAELAGESSDSVKALADSMGASAFFQRGFSEVRYSWAVILICSITACILSAIWIWLLRWILAPIVYLCIILILVLLIAVGYLAMLIADDLENNRLPNDTATDDQIKMWRAVQWTCFIAAGIYFVAMIWMLKRIRIAIAIMKEASKAFLDNPGLVIIPPIVFVCLLGMTAFFIVSAVYIQTVGELTEEDFRTAANDRFGETLVNGTLNAIENAGNSSLYANISTALGANNTNATQNSTTWEQDEILKAMHAYNFFGFLWMANFFIMFGFFIMASVTCAWYYSATAAEIKAKEDGDDENGRYKSAALGSMCRSVKMAAVNHLGTILWGSLCIAIIQFIRALFLYVKEAFLDEWKDTATVKILIYCIDCWLACIERVIKIISKNAFIVTIIMNTSFCESARTAMAMLTANVVRLGALATMSTIACFILKLFIVGSNMVVAYFLIQVEALTENQEIESGLFPLVGIFFLTFIIASLFVNVYESCVDTILMCFFIDEDKLECAFLPSSLWALVDNFSHVEVARRDYEKKLKNATNGKKADPEKEEPEAKDV